MMTPEPADTSAILVEVPPGELLGKITLLEIKAERISDPTKLRNVRRELELLRKTRIRYVADEPEIARLEAEIKSVNETPWVIADDIRDCERREDSGAAFVKLARSVYRANDGRAALKRMIGGPCGSAIIEEKWCSAY